MGHKIFVSYKYHDNNVMKITDNIWHNDTVRDYVDKLETYFDKTDNIYKGEEDGEDLSSLSDDAIWEKLKDRIYDSTLTIVLISPNMKTCQRERDQWIPWEISYSLKEIWRKNSTGNNVKSSSNAMIALVLPDRNGSYSYYIEDKSCCQSTCRLLKTNTLFYILKQNMFNVKNADKDECSIGDIVYHGDSSYILSVKWKNFIGNPTQYIEKAYKIQNSIEQYDICFEVEMYY